MNQSPLPENVANCDQEPIHALGFIQSHGALLCFGGNGMLLACSENASSLLGSLPDIGTSLEDGHLDRCARIAIQKAFHNRGLAPDSFEWIASSGDRFDVVIHWAADEALLVEFELIPVNAPDASQFASYCQRAIHRIRAKQYTDIAELLAETAGAIRDMTGFDRVMGLRFHSDGSGEIIAESLESGLSPYLNQRYPSSDIPAQARRLYLLNPIRQNASVGSPPVPIAPHVNLNTGAPWDLSHSILRSVSPIHIEYLRNMGVHASMSVSIIVDDRLWGLFVCHHMTPFRTSHAVRLSCTLLTQVVSIFVSQTESRARLTRDHHAQVTGSEIAACLADAEDFSAGLAKAGSKIADLIGCERAFAVVDHEVLSLDGSKVHGHTQLIALARHMASTRTDVLATSCWNEDLGFLEPVGSETGPAAGCLAIQTGGDACVTVIWLRDEVVQTINWAGPRDKVVASGPNGLRLTPRGSFEVWKQTVTGSSRAWSQADQRGARALKSILQGVAFQRMQEAERARTTLLATLGHDLRNPLQGINMAMLLMGRGLASSTDTARRVEGSTRRMQSLINYILDVSRIRSGLGLALSCEQVSLRDLIENTVEDNRLAHPSMSITTHLDDCAGDVYVDPDRFAQALTNLISNARQHGDMTYPIEVSSTLEDGQNVVKISNRVRERPITTFARLVDPFKSGSLNNPNNRDGLGLGLYIANAIVKGHNAKLDGSFDDTTARVTIRLANGSNTATSP